MVTIFNDITQNLVPLNWMNQSDLSHHPKLTQNLKSWLYETALLTTRLLVKENANTLVSPAAYSSAQLMQLG